MSRSEPPAIVRVARKRMRRMEQLSLAAVHEPAHIAALAEPEPALLAAIRSGMREDRATLQATQERHATALAAQFCAWVWRHDQFVEIDDGARSRIQSVYRSSLARALRLSDPLRPTAAFAEVRSLLAQHGEGLRLILLDLPAGTTRRVSAEYSPGAQLRVLRMSHRELDGPVLDVGCGSNARLVRHLRGRGLEVVGIDRRTSRETEVDWLTYAPGAQKWRTILSHQAFSLHFLHHHRRGSAATAEQYARAYMRYVRAIRVGGVFAYSPSLPFIEWALPADRWSVSAVHGEIDGVPTSATHITRRD